MCNGSTTDSGSVCEGSTPSAPAVLWPYRLAWSRTPPSHGGDSGSNPDRANEIKEVCCLINNTPLLLAATSLQFSMGLNGNKGNIVFNNTLFCYNSGSNHKKAVAMLFFSNKNVFANSD